MVLPGSDLQDLSALAKYAKGIDHIAVAVPDLEISINWFTSVLGFSLRERRTTEGATTGMISAVLVAGPLNIVLLQGTSPKSQVSRFIENYGPGVQHLAIEVNDIDSLSRELGSSGFEFDTSIIEGGGLRQIFSKRDQGCGVMIEFIQRAGPGFAEQNVTSLFAQLEEKDSF
jgi:methylmalonyl-CoA/ethylmalonyl-CoA epimerase